MKNLLNKHSFVICAYKDSPFLEDCILSLKNQTVKSSIIMITSTPNAHIKSLAHKYNIPLRINDGEGGIVQDWNFGYSQCKTPYVTIAHQDDIYFSDYAEHAIMELENSDRPLIYFSGYCEIRNEEKIYNNKLLNVKKKLLFPLRAKCFQKSKFVRRRVLSLGAAICCPAVTFAVNNLPNPVFEVHYRSCEDWEAWEKISRLKGGFLYDPKVRMGHRIHEGSETSIILGDNARNKEDFEMFCKFWPTWIAKILAKIYATSENSNIMD